MTVHGVFHRDLDGITAAALLGNKIHVDKWYPTLDRSFCPQTEVGDKVYYLDLSPSNQAFQELEACEVVVYDHHATDRDRIPEFLDMKPNYPIKKARIHGSVFVDMDCSMSATKLVYTRLYTLPKEARGSLWWELAEVVNTHDLWRWRTVEDGDVRDLYRSMSLALNEIAESVLSPTHAGYGVEYPKVFLETVVESGRGTLVSRGNLISAMLDPIIDSIVSKAENACIWYGEDRKVMVPVISVCSPYLPNISNWVADKLSERYPESLLVTYHHALGKWKYSFRGRDVFYNISSKDIAEYWGGGGHPMAAGCEAKEFIIVFGG